MYASISKVSFTVVIVPPHKSQVGLNLYSILMSKSANQFKNRLLKLE